MTVYLPKRCRTWYYDFWFQGHRYLKSTGQLTREDAEDVETQAMRAVRRRAAGLPPLETAGVEGTPRFTDWAVVTLRYAKERKKLKRPEQFAINLRMVLGFWGARPKEPIADAPYHDLRLGDPIRDPDLLEKFEEWMDARGISGPRKNHYRSACSQMFRVALLASHKKRSAVRENPFAHGLRDRVPKRIRIFTTEQLRQVITGAPWHIRIALAIGALAPKLRLKNVLDLQWQTHVAPDLSEIVNPDHKTDQETGLPLVVRVSKELRAVLVVAKLHRHGRYVVHYNGKHISDIKTGLKRAVTAAGLVLAQRDEDLSGEAAPPRLIWGRAKGVTYHSLRHTMATELARMGVSEVLQTRVMGWASTSTARIYTHMVAEDEVAPLEALGLRMPVADVIGTPNPASGPASGPRFGRRKKSNESAVLRRTVRVRRRAPGPDVTG